MPTGVTAHDNSVVTYYLILLSFNFPDAILSMKILVCICEIFEKTDVLRIDKGGKSINKSSLSCKINPDDESALAFACLLRDMCIAETVSIITVGAPDQAENLIRKALGICGDAGVIIDSEYDDPLQTALALSNYIRSEKYDLILCGQKSADFQSGIVGAMLAALLGWNFIGQAINAQVDGQYISAQSMEQFEIISRRTALPLVISCRQELAEPRVGTLRGILSAKDKSVEIVTPVLLAKFSEVVGYIENETKTTEFIAPDDLSRAAVILYELTQNL